MTLRGGHADGGSIYTGKHYYAEARTAAAKTLPESSEGSGMTPDDDDESNDSTSPSGALDDNHLIPLITSCVRRN